MSALVFALPSKGRLQDQAVGFLADAGLTLVQSRGARDYAATFDGIADVAVSLLSSSEIADELYAGRVHLGVCGEDLLAERGAFAEEERVAKIERLGFGGADLVVAVPRAWIDVSTMSDLDDVAADFHRRHHRRLRVATKYMSLTRAFFASHGVADYRIVESLGATEGAPAAGTAEAIVDITTTGATLAANDLKILDDGKILESQAVLAASLRAQWSDAAKRAARTLLDRIAARAEAKAARIVRVRLDKGLEASLPALESKHGVKVLARPGAGDATGEVALLVPETQLATAIALLRASGSQSAVTAQKTDYVFTADNPLYAKLTASLRR